MKICALIPAYNEEETVGMIIKETKKYIDAVFVINNGSTDRTAAVASEHGAIVINYDAKRGYGAAQYAGQQHVIAQGYDYILQLDADGQHDPNYIPQFLKIVHEDDFDLIIGSRFRSANRIYVSFMRKMGIIFFSTVISILGTTRLTDVTSGFKVYKASSLTKLTKPSDINPAIEQIMEITKKGMKIKEISIVMPNRITGNTHLNGFRFSVYPFRATWHIIKVLLFK